MADKSTKPKWSQDEWQRADLSPLLDFSLAAAVMNEVHRSGAAQQQLDWMDVMYHLRDSSGVFSAGDLAPAADLFCEQCGGRHPLYVAQRLSPCNHCGHTVFIYQDNYKH